MPITININGLSLCHKGSEGWVHNTLPDVCKTPSKGKPIPYENEAYSRDLVKGTTTVFADGGNMIANLGSEFAISVFDEPGTMGGIKSGTHMAEADWISHSFDVFFEGKPACRLTDKMFMNHRNTVSMSGECQKDLSPAEFEEWLCKLACECWNQHKPDGPEPLGQGQQYQSCLNRKIEEECYDGPYPRDDAGAWREVPFDRGSGWDMIESGTQPGSPTSNPIRGNSRRPDVIRVGKDGMQTIYDVKFPTDPSGGGNMPPERVEDYRDIAERHTGDKRNFKEFNIDEKCGGCGDPNLIPVAVGAKEAERGFLDKLGDALFESTGVRLAGAALVAYAVVSVATRLYPPRNAVPLP
ncbi:DUF4150 domain-containing protein [Thauera butanivorans]|uniref:DUF4150 domain-containing protein n=1 Tax=Thauera butanivorans TaxID=86174 RepID=UPI003AB53C03